MKEAYLVLSDKQQRAKYDQELRIQGYTDNDEILLKEEDILNAVLKLKSELYGVGINRINRYHLQLQLLQLTNDTHISIIEAADKNTAITGVFYREILLIAERLPYRYFLPISLHLSTTCLNSDALQQNEKLLRKKEFEKKWLQIRPWLVLLATSLICVAMFFWVNKG